MVADGRYRLDISPVPETDNGNQPVSMTQRLSSEDTSEQCFWRIKRVK